MNKLKIAAATLALAAIGSIVPASAQIITEFDVPKSNNSFGDASGSYHIKFTSLSPTNWLVDAWGNFDGNLSGPQGGAGAQKSSVHFITLDFLGAGNAFVPVSSGSGGTNAGDEAGMPGVNPTHAFTGGAWTVDTSGQIYDSASNGAPTYLSAFGANTYHGAFTLAAGGVKTVEVAFQDGNQQWQVVHGLSTVPEVSSLAMLIPGLLPIGLVMRRRRQNGS